MNTSLYYVIYLFQRFSSLIFNNMTVGENAPSLGYIVLAVMLIGMIIKTVVFLPRGAKIDLYKKGGDKE